MFKYCFAIAIALMSIVSGNIVQAQTQPVPPAPQAQPAPPKPARPVYTPLTTNPAPRGYDEVAQTSIAKAEQCKASGGKLVADLNDCRAYPVSQDDPAYETKKHWRECNNRCIR